MYKYNLVIFHVPKNQSIADFLTIRNMMVGRAPDIEVHILSTAMPIVPDFWRKAAARPTLFFSPRKMLLDPGHRGARLISRQRSKLEEADLVTRAGFVVPEMGLITPETRIDEAQWGPFTVVKPNRGAQGRGTRLVRTRDVRWIDTSALPKTDPRHGQELVAQRYVDTGPLVTSYRVMTVLGRPIYCMTSTALAKRPALDAKGAGALDLEVAANGMARKLALSNDGDVIELATSVHRKLPDIPVMGIDIIREKETGRLFVLEFNSGGRTWHLSSNHGQGHQREFRLDYYGQFNALNTITDALIEVTRQRAM